MPSDSDRMDLLLQCLKVTESTVLGLKQVRRMLPKGASTEIFDSLIEEAEKHLEEVKRKIIQ
jgi:hypothetical protein